MRRPPYRMWIKLMFDCEYSRIPHQSPQFIRFLIYCLRNHHDKRMRCICAHHASLIRNKRLESALLARASDLREHPTVRGDCLESLKTNWWKHVSPNDRRARRVVLQCLRDADPYVRFWACYAVAKLRMHSAIPVLETMTGDLEPAAMGETVGFEATEAIKDLKYGTGWDNGFPSKLPPAKSFENLFINPYE